MDLRDSERQREEERQRDRDLQKGMQALPTQGDGSWVLRSRQGLPQVQLVGIIAGGMKEVSGAS